MVEVYFVKFIIYGVEWIKKFLVSEDGFVFERKKDLKLSLFFVGM